MSIMERYPTLTEHLRLEGFKRFQPAQHERLLYRPPAPRATLDPSLGDVMRTYPVAGWWPNPFDAVPDWQWTVVLRVKENLGLLVEPWPGSGPFTVQLCCLSLASEGLTLERCDWSVRYGDPFGPNGDSGTIPAPLYAYQGRLVTRPLRYATTTYHEGPEPEWLAWYLERAAAMALEVE